MQRMLTIVVDTVEFLGSLASFAGLAIALRVLQQERATANDVSILKREEETWHAAEEESKIRHAG